MAKLHKISTEEVDSYVDQCHKKYGNLLTLDQQRNYIRAVIEADHPFQYFQLLEGFFVLEEVIYSGYPMFLNGFVNFITKMGVKFMSIFTIKKELRWAILVSPIL